MALGVAAFSLVVILGLLHSGLTSEKATIGQTVASGIVSSLYSDIAATPDTQNASLIYQVQISGAISSTPQTLYFSQAGEATGPVGAAPTDESRYRASVGMIPASPPNPAMLRIVVTWPALADPNPTTWATQATDSVEVLTALQR